MLSLLEFLQVPSNLAVVLACLFLVSQVIGELLELKGKVVPEFVKIRKYFQRKKQERKEIDKTLKEVQQLLNDVNQHYSSDNITKRDSWMKWVNERANVYDSSIIEISAKLDDAVQALNNNTKMTEELFVQQSRDRIIDFATKASDKNAAISREEFNRIFKVHDKYERFLEDHELTNGEIDVAMRVITESYEGHMINHTFIEDVRGYNL